MLSRQFKLFSVLGIPFRLHVSWLPLAPLIALTLAYVVFPTLVPELSIVDYWAMALAGTLGMFLSALLRELMQAFVSRLRDVPPRGIILAAIGGAWQINDRGTCARNEVWLVASGLVASLALSAALFTALFGTATSATPLSIAGVMFFLAVVNAGLAAVNLMPVYPLGTGRLLRTCLLKHAGSVARATRVAAAVGFLIGIAAAACGAVVLARGSTILGAWLVLVGTIVCWVALSAKPLMVGGEQ